MVTGRSDRHGQSRVMIHSSERTFRFVFFALRTCQPVLNALCAQVCVPCGVYDSAAAAAVASAPTAAAGGTAAGGGCTGRKR